MTVFIIESDVNTVAWLRPRRGAIDSRARHVNELAAYEFSQLNAEI